MGKWMSGRVGEWASGLQNGLRRRRKLPPLSSCPKQKIFKWKNVMYFQKNTKRDQDQKASSTLGANDKRCKGQLTGSVQVSMSPVLGHCPIKLSARQSSSSFSCPQPIRWTSKLPQLIIRRGFTLRRLSLPRGHEAGDPTGRGQLGTKQKQSSISLVPVGQSGARDSAVFDKRVLGRWRTRYEQRYALIATRLRLHLHRREIAQPRLSDWRYYILSCEDEHYLEVVGFVRLVRSVVSL